MEEMRLPLWLSSFFFLLFLNSYKTINPIVDLTD